MKTSAEIRLINAQALATGGPAEFARRMEMTGQQANQIIGPHPKRQIGSTQARKIEEAYGKEIGWLDNDHSKNNVDVLISTANHALSEEAKDLILCVAQLDTVGDLARQTFVYARGLLHLSSAFAELQTGVARSKMLAETERLLSSGLEISGPTNDRKNKK
jgi:hypothetical protein